MINNIMLFDIDRYVKKLQKSGFTEAQIGVQVEFVKSISNTINNDLSTKQDLKELKNELRLEISNLRVEFMQLGYKAMFISYCVAFGGILLAGITVLGFMLQRH